MRPSELEITSEGFSMNELEQLTAYLSDPARIEANEQRRYREQSENNRKATELGLKLIRCDGGAWLYSSDNNDIRDCLVNTFQHECREGRATFPQIDRTPMEEASKHIWETACEFPFWVLDLFPSFLFRPNREYEQREERRLWEATAAWARANGYYVPGGRYQTFSEYAVDAMSRPASGDATYWAGREATG